MGAIAAVFVRNDREVASSQLEQVLAPLAVRGPHHVGCLVRGKAALGECGSGPAQGQTGPRGPLTDESRGLLLAADLRLDNRRELLEALRSGAGPQARPIAKERAAGDECDDGDEADDNRLSDGELVLWAYAKWQEDCFARLIGPMAVVLYDAPRRRLLLARDAMGDRPLYYSSTTDLLVAASEEHAVTAHPSIGDRIDDVWLASYYAVRSPPLDRTCFASVREVPPGCVMIIGESSERRIRHWEPDPTLRLSYADDREYAAAFRECLTRAVADRLRDSLRPAVMMSGGLDSTAVAATAARLEAEGRYRSGPPDGTGAIRRHRPVRLATYSYVFDELTQCDERRYIAPVVERHDLDATLLAVDHLWPLAEIDKWPYNPNSPHEIPYRLVIDRVLSACTHDGTSVLLTGTFGDELYTGVEDWLVDLVAERRFGEAVSGLAHLLKGGLYGPGIRVAARSLRRAGARALGRRSWRPEIACEAPEWLTPRAQRTLVDGLREAALYDEAEGGGAGLATLAREGRRPEQWERVLGPRSAYGSVFSQYHARRFGLEMRHPFRDRRLVELMLAVPAHQLYGPSGAKHILREAMRGLLPEIVRARRKPTSLVPLYHRGVAQREAGLVRALLEAPDALWRDYVREEWLMSHLPSPASTLDVDPTADVAVWNCVSAELWWRRREGLDLPRP